MPTSSPVHPILSLALLFASFLLLLPFLPFARAQDGGLSNNIDSHTSVISKGFTITAGGAAPAGGMGKGASWVAVLGGALGVAAGML